MLSFRLDEIPESGLDVNRDIGEEWMNALLTDQYSCGGKSLRLCVCIRKLEESVNVSGSMELDLSFACRRCAENFPLRFKHDFASVYIAKPAKEVNINEDMTSGQELVVSYHNGATVDIEPLIAEEFVLSLPQYPLCREDCKGICQRCGKNLNELNCGCAVETVNTAWSKLKDFLPERS